MRWTELLLWDPKEPIDLSRCITLYHTISYFTRADVVGFTQTIDLINLSLNQHQP
jgi:hypothetical protein